jgi:hypothetical protein
MARHLKVAAAQLDRIHKADDQDGVVVRPMALVREVACRGHAAAGPRSKP